MLVSRRLVFVGLTFGGGLIIWILRYSVRLNSEGILSVDLRNVEKIFL